MFKLASRPVALLALVVTAGCGDDGGTEPAGSIAVAVTPSTLSIIQGESGTLTLSLTRGGGFADPVNVAVDGVPAGVTASVTPAQLTGSTAQATVTVDVASTVAAGSYLATIRANAAGVDAATIQFALTVTAIPDFALSASPANIPIGAGTSGTTAVSISRTNMSGTVSLALVSPPTGITATFVPSTPTANSSAATINVASDVPPGAYTLTIRGTASGITGERTTAVAVTVTTSPSFSLGVSPDVISAVTGGAGTTTVSIVRTNLTADVGLTLVNAPAGITGAFTPGTLSGTTLASSLAITVANSVAPGTYLLTVRAAGGSLVQTAPIAVTVLAQSVAFNTTPSLLSVERGSSGSSTLNVVRTGFGGGIAPAVSGNPPGMTLSFNPNPITGASAAITVTVGPSVLAGTYNVVIDASGVPGTPSATLVVVVTSAGGGGSGNIVWEFCNNEPLPLMFWRKSNGSWSEVTGTTIGNVTRYEFTATGTDAGVAFTRQVATAAPSKRVARSVTNFQQVARQARELAAPPFRKRGPNVGALMNPYFETFALYAIASELAGQAETCANGALPVSKTFMVTGMSAGEAGALGYGPGAAVLSPAQSAYNVQVPAGTYDWLAAFGPQPTPPAPLQSWTHYQLGRGEAAPGADVTVNRANAKPFATAPFVVNGGSQGSLYQYLHTIRSSRGNVITLSAGAPGTVASGNMPFLAATDRLPTDMHSLVATNTELSGSNDIFTRSITMFLGSAPPAGTTAVTLPPAVPNFAITQAGTLPYPSWRASGSIPAFFQTDVGAISTTFQDAGEATLTIVSATRNWLVSQGMSSDYFITSPMALPGFQAAWAATDPLLEGAVTMFGTNITGGVPLPGSLNFTSTLLKQPP